MSSCVCIAINILLNLAFLSVKGERTFCNLSKSRFAPSEGFRNVFLSVCLALILLNFVPCLCCAGREQFHGLGSMYCRGAAAVILTYDVTNWQSLAELENRFLSLTDTANADCIFAIVGNKADLTDTHVQGPDTDGEQADEPQPVVTCPTSPTILHKQVSREDAIALYSHVLRYKGLEEKACLPADKMCFETSAKTGYNVDALFESLFDLLLPSILKKRSEGESSTVDLESPMEVKTNKAGCCS